MRIGRWIAISWLSLMAMGLLAVSAGDARGQSYGIELHNALMPASGGMGGASLTQPQDLQSAINGNPATLTQFQGTQFSVSGAWAEPTYRVTQYRPLPLVGVDPFNAKSSTPGGVAGNIGVTQDFSALGLPFVFGTGLMTNAAAGVNFRGVPESHGTSAEYIALDIPLALGVQLTDRLSAGAALTLGSSYLDGPFVDMSAMTPAYALRGTLGLNYCLNDDTSVGVYWQSLKNFTFADAVVLRNGAAEDVKFAHPENIGLGIANHSLMDGRLLLAFDAIYKQHSKADFLRAIYKDQWVYQLGAQYAVNCRTRLRFGYAYNDNPMCEPVVDSVGGVPLPDGVPGVRYVQGQFASICQHRLTGGVGLRDVLPGVDFDLLAGYMFHNSDRLADTLASVEGYWLGAGITWRFGRGACERLPVPTEW
jgi:long-chain fatty acid transport protein